MKICTWNINKATKKREVVWKYLLAMDADIIFLQEVNSIPEFISLKYSILARKAITKNDTLQQFSTAILVKGTIKDEIKLYSKHEWVNRELERFNGNLIAAKIVLDSGFEVNLISVYSPAWVIPRNRWKNMDITNVKLENNPDVWVTEILYSSLLNVNLNDTPWIIGGDFNSSPTFDLTFSSGNQEILDRMNSLGLLECLEKFNNRLVPTFKNPKGGKIIHQIDHLFVTPDMYKNINTCIIGNRGIIFKESLSDHLPIICEFK